MLDWVLPTRLTARELAMLKTMDSITDRPNWESDVFNSQTTEALRREMKAREPLLSPKAWAWCLEELQDKARSFVRTGRVLVYDAGIRVSKSSLQGSERMERLVCEMLRTDDGWGR